jgi:hypothetical protein
MAEETDMTDVPQPAPTGETAGATAVAGAADARPTGPVAAMLLATGIGTLVLGVLVVAAAASESFATSLAYSERVGPLAGKTIWAIVAFLLSWAVLTVALRGRDVNLRTVLLISGIMLALGLLFTFPPFFQAFAPSE